MERRHAGLRDVAHPVDVLPQMWRMIGTGSPLGELDVQLLQIAVVVLARDEVAGGVIGQGQRVGAGLDLGQAERDRRLLEPLEDSLRRRGSSSESSRNGSTPKE